MSWSAEDKVRVAAALPWTVEPTVDVAGMHVVRIAELRGFIVTAESERMLGREYHQMLRSFLLSYFNDDQEPPYPAGASPLPWQPSFPKAPQTTVIEAADAALSSGAGSGGHAPLALGMAA